MPGDIFHMAGEEEVAVRIDGAAQAGVQPAICVDRASSHYRPLPVALHHLRPTNQQLALILTIESQIVPSA